MARYSQPIFLVVLSLLACTGTFGQPELNDSQNRESASARVMKNHGIQIDWKNKSLLEIMDIEAKLDTVARIKSDHEIVIDWQKTPLLELIDAEARLSAVKRIKDDHGVSFDWHTTSLIQLIDAEARMKAARRIGLATKQSIDWTKHSLQDLSRMEAGLNQTSLKSGTETTLFDILFPPAKQKAMGLHKLTQVEKQELSKHVQSLLIIAASRTGTLQQIGTRPNQQQSGLSSVPAKVYAGVGGGHWVKKNVDSGTYMILEDSSLWQIDPFDKIDAMLWLPISNITVTESSNGSPGFDYLLINTDDDEKAHAKYVGNQ